MQREVKRPPTTVRPGCRDWWEFTIKLIIALLIAILFIQDYMQEQELDLFKLILVLVLLAFIVGLILRQRHVILLRCKLTAPSGCVKGDPNLVAGKVLELVSGSAYGFGFGYYLLEVRDPGGNLLSDVVVYPDGSGNPDTSLTQGNLPVTSGKLGWVDVEKAANDAGILLLTSTTFEITLRVYGVDGLEHATCKTTFTLSVNEVYIKRVSTPWSVDFTNPAEPLRRTDDPSAELATIGGAMHVRGAADIYGCAGENIAEYSIWAIPDPTFSFAQPAPFTPVTPQPDWVLVTHIEFKSQTVDGTVYSADDVRAYNVLDADPDPDILTNVWGTRKECICVVVDSTVICNCWKIPDLKASAFNSNAGLLPYKLDPSHTGGTGKFTFLLQVIDTSGQQFYDIQRAWIDNEPIQGKIDGVGAVGPCEDLYARDASGAYKTVEVRGTAWDALIDPSDVLTGTPTNDNFDRYEVKIQKQGAAGESLLHSATTPVPARPLPAGIGVLTNWDLSSLDAGTNPMGWPADQLLGPGESCTYDVILRVWDKTVVNEHTVHYTGKITFPIKIINGSATPTTS